MSTIEELAEEEAKKEKKGYQQYVPGMIVTPGAPTFAGIPVITPTRIDFRTFAAQELMGKPTGVPSLAEFFPTYRGRAPGYRPPEFFAAGIGAPAPEKAPPAEKRPTMPPLGWAPPVWMPTVAPPPAYMPPAVPPSYAPPPIVTAPAPPPMVTAPAPPPMVTAPAPTPTPTVTAGPGPERPVIYVPPPPAPPPVPPYPPPYEISYPKPTVEKPSYPKPTVEKPSLVPMGYETVKPTPSLVPMGYVKAFPEASIQGLAVQESKRSVK